MKKIRLSVMALIAILAVSVAVVTKAHTFGKKQVTACFQTLLATTGGTSPATIQLAPLACDELPAAVSAHPYVASASSGITDPEDVCLDEVVFCCATVAETQDQNAPLINLDGTPKRYVIQETFCRAE